MSTLRSSCALVLMLTGTAASAAAQGYATQGYDQQQQQYSQQQYQQYPQQQQYQQGQQYQQYPQQQQQPQQQQPPPGYFPTPDAQGAYNYQQQMAPNGYPEGQQPQNDGSNEQLVSSVAGAFQIGAGISLIEVNSLSMNQDMAPAAAPPTMMVTPPAMMAAAPAAAPMDPVVTTVGVVKNPLYLELGYGFAKNMVIGAIGAFSNTSESLNNGAIPAKDFVLSFAPKFDYHFTPTSRVNPFIGGMLSISYENKTYFGLRDTRMLFGLAARGGLRLFVLDGLSIDPTVSLGGNFGSGKQQNLTKSPNSDSSYSASALHFAISMGISAWIK